VGDSWECRGPGPRRHQGQFALYAPDLGVSLSGELPPARGRQCARKSSDVFLYGQDFVLDACAMA